MVIKDSQEKESEVELKADLVLLAMGFVHPVKDRLIKDSGIKLDSRGNVEANDLDYKTNIKKVFVSGDMRRGQSLVVWAIKEGRQVAHNVDKFLMGSTTLPFWGKIDILLQKKQTLGLVDNEWKNVAFTY